MDALKGKRVLVTGGTKGIGRALVLAFARAGARVVTCYHSDESAAADVSAELKELSDQHQVLRGDVTSATEVAVLAEQISQYLGGLDVLVNNVGLDGMSPFSALVPAEWKRVLDGSITATYLTTQAMLPLLADGASVVNIGSSVATRGRPNAVHYTTAKAALLGFTKALSRELGPRGIRVNTVAPGLTETEPGAGLPPQILRRIVGMTALGRIGQPEDVAGPVLFFAGDGSKYVTGTTLNVDGGV